MSWQTYVDEHLMCEIEGTGQHLSSAAIFGTDGTVWAKSSAFPEVILFVFKIYYTILYVSYFKSFYYLYRKLLLYIYLL